MPLFDTLRWEIELLFWIMSRATGVVPDACVGVPTLDPVFNDYQETAATDAGRCLKRAREWLNACGSSGPVTARFFNAGLQTKVERADSPTHCQITFPPEGCRRHPTAGNMAANDDYEGSASDETRCMKRAREYFYACDATQGSERHLPRRHRERRRGRLPLPAPSG